MIPVYVLPAVVINIQEEQKIEKLLRQGAGMEKKTALCILNPVAGRLRAPQGMQDMISTHIGKEYDVRFFITTAKGDAAREAAAVGPEVSLLICCGGDGTLNEIISGMRRAGVKRPVLFVPCGTTNDLAKTLGLPAKPEHNILSFAVSRPIDMDAGLFNQTSCFTYIAAFGAFTEVSYKTSQSSKNKLGYFAYLSHFFSGLFRVRGHRLTAWVDGEQVRGNYMFGSITNSLSIGGVLKLHGQGVALGDGLLEVLLVERPRTIFLFPLVGLKLLLKKYNTRGILLKQCKRISLQFEKETDWTIDGEYGGKMSRVDIENLPHLYQIYSR